MSTAYVNEQQNDQQNELSAAIELIQHRISRLSVADQIDVFDLLQSLRDADAEEREKVAKLFVEILSGEKKKGGIRRIQLADISPDRSLKQWMDFISARIREARTAKGMTQSQLAKLAGLQQSHLSRIENAEHSPTNKTLVKIAGALGIEVSELDPSA